MARAHYRSRRSGRPRRPARSGRLERLGRGRLRSSVDPQRRADMSALADVCHPPCPTRLTCQTCLANQAVRGLVLMRRSDEGGEERMRLRRLRLELGVELDGEVPRVPWQLRDLDELAVR